MADIEDFDLDKTTRQAWAAFTERLADVLSVMDATADLTISVARGEDAAAASDPVAVRFSAIAPGVIEATLTGIHGERLQDLGWDLAGGRTAVRRDQEHAAELAALTTETMRDIVGVLHPIFLEPDQLAELLTSGNDAIKPPEPGPFGIVMPTSQAQLDAIIDAELARLFGHSAARNPMGDVAIRVGSTVVFCRSTPDFKELVLFAALVHDVSGRSRACEVLNDLNVESRYCRFALHRDRVFAQVSVPAQPFVPQHFRQALDSISQVADGIDDDLASKLGGRTTFPATS
ncbi:MAG: hypothetical protein Q4D79_08950 [Propionibacteriaceae bacterium]|nr:hypothetical protein [Propionibacteriaceae bacterium]